MKAHVKTSKQQISLAAFRNFLDEMFGVGYALEFEQDNPQAFYRQFFEFRINHLNQSL